MAAAVLQHRCRIHPRSDALDGFEHELLEFVSVWAGYGGPPDEELLPRFGVSRADLSARIHEIVLATGYLDCKHFKSTP
ncbi:hypothetical protein [Mycobacterium sp. ACS4331]|uniref:hypothetical protein n=1 Tax=Mycobacterium sp. ACS4331 TaxID=1834121 RepID=UPI000801773C|nr:hypothetical protein [Mycobacterium sp. ACS4331]OBF13626.1 hypothetical protein A5727_16250 [Mycobacterium sp. ACS4331]